MTKPSTVSENMLFLMQERDYWNTIVSMARPLRDRKLHAYAKKMVKLLGKDMIEAAREQMEEGFDLEEESEEEKLKRLIAEDKKPASERITEKAMVKAMSENDDWGDGFFA